MATIGQIIDRYAEQAGTDEPRFLHSKSANVYVGSRYGYRTDHSDTLYSYGSHFPLAQIMPGSDGTARGWWLLNGDNYSPSTARHQSDTRGALKRTGLPMLIVPFSALREAGIDRASITPVDITPDTWETITHTASTLEGVPESRRAPEGVEVTEGNAMSDYYAWQDDSLPTELPGHWHWRTREHHLGASVFTAEYEYSGYADPSDRESWRTVTGTASFLSAFDENEPRQLYFLAQLPEGSHPQTVAAALEALKPREVIDAEADGLAVLRQGDVFAIPTGSEDDPTSTRWMRKHATTTTRGGYVLGVNHTVTESAVMSNGETYGRGIMRHRPTGWGRAPEHRNVKLGDRKTWHRLVLNTVPTGRSWSMGGRVD